MFITVKHRCSIMDDYIRYVQEARLTRLTDKEYEESMERELTKHLKGLKRVSTNNRLIAKYENAINELFDRTV